MVQIIPTLLKYLIGILGVGIIVLLHEVGHFIAARIFKIDVEIFSIGFGPKMLSIKSGKTEYRISWFLFGGYCKMKGADDLTRALDHNKKEFVHVEHGSLFSVNPANKFLVYLAGPITNFILTILLCSALFYFPYKTLSTEAIVSPISEYPQLFNNSNSPAADFGVKKNDKILKINNIEINDWQEFKNQLEINNYKEITLLIERDNQLFNVIIEGEETSSNNYRFGLTYLIDTKISLVRLFSPEYKAGLKKGDIIRKVNGSSVYNNLDLISILNKKDTKNITLEIERNDETKTIKYIPNYNNSNEIINNFSLTSDTKQIDGIPFFKSIIKGYEMSIKLFSDTVISIKNLITRNNDDIRTVITGPMRASLMIGNITVLGFENSFASGLRAFFYLLSIVSISLTIANLLPIPAFDGGQMLISLIEIVTKKRFSPKHYWITQIFGLICVIALFAIMYFVDIKYFLTMN